MQCKRPGFDSWVGKIPWRRKWQLTPVFLPGESHGAWQATVYGISRVGHDWATKHTLFSLTQPRSTMKQITGLSTKHKFIEKWFSFLYIYIYIYIGLPWWFSGLRNCLQCRRHRKHGFNCLIRMIHGGRNGSPLQYSCLENSMDRGAWWAIVQRVTKSQTWLTKHPYMCVYIYTHTHTHAHTYIVYIYSFSETFSL